MSKLRGYRFNLRCRIRVRPRQTVRVDVGCVSSVGGRFRNGEISLIRSRHCRVQLHLLPEQPHPLNRPAGFFDIDSVIRYCVNVAFLQDRGGFAETRMTSGLSCAVTEWSGVPARSGTRSLAMKGNK